MDGTETTVPPSQTNSKVVCAAGNKVPPKLFAKVAPKANSPSTVKVTNNSTATSTSKKDALTPLGSLFAHLLDWRTFTNWPTDAKAALYSLLPYVEDNQSEKVEDLRFRVAFTEARGVDLLYGILLCNTYDKARDQSVARLLMKILLCLKHVYPEIQDEIESIAFNTTAVTAAVHCLSRDFDDETAELGLAALRELKRHASSSCRHSDDDEESVDERLDDEDLDDDGNGEEEVGRPVVKQRKRTVAQRTPEAIRKAIDMSLISDIIETIATAGTKDEVILSKRYHYLQLVLALPFVYISGDLAEQLLFLHEKGDTTTHQKAIKELIAFSVMQLNEGRDGFINAASYCYKDHGRIALEDPEILNLSRSIIWLHKQRKLSLWWGSALVVARCLQDNTRTRDRRDLATCFLSLVGDPALEENSDSPLFVLGELLANEMSNASRSLHSILMKLGLLEVLSRCLKDAIDCYTVQNCVYCVEHLQCSASRLLETDVVGFIAESIDCKRTGCDGECEKIAGRTLLQLLLMSGISEVEQMVRRNYTDPFILGIASRSEECLKKFFVMPPSLITKIFTTYPAHARDRFLADVAALTKHKNTKIASIASSMYPTLVQFRNADTKSWLSKCLKSKLAFDTQEYKLKTKNALVKSSGSKVASSSKRPTKTTLVQGVPNDTIHLMASGDYDGALLLCASCVDGSKARKADTYAWMVNGIAHVMRALPSGDHPSCPHTMKKAATMLNLAKTRANGGGQWLSVIHTFLAVAYAFLSSVAQSCKEWKWAVETRTTANYSLGVIHYPPLATTACDAILDNMQLYDEVDVQEITLIYEHIGHISLVLGVYSTSYASYSRWIALDPASEVAKEGLAKALSLNSKLAGQRSNRNKASRREERSWGRTETLRQASLDMEDDALLDFNEGDDDLDGETDQTKGKVLCEMDEVEAEAEESKSTDAQAEKEEKRLRELLLKMKSAQEQLKRKNDEVEKLVNEVQGKVDSKAEKRKASKHAAPEQKATPTPAVMPTPAGPRKSKEKPESTVTEDVPKEKSEAREQRLQEEKEELERQENEEREDRRRKEAERVRREEERRAREEEERRRREEERRLKREVEKRLKQEANLRRKKEEERRQKEEEERRKREEQRRQRVEEERRRREEEEDRRRKEEEERHRKEEERRRKEEEERRKKEEERRLKMEEERRLREEEVQQREEERRRKLEEKRREKDEKARERTRREAEERKRREDEERRRQEEEERRLAEWPTCAESCQPKSEDGGVSEGEKKRRKQKSRKDASVDEPHVASSTSSSQPTSLEPAAIAVALAPIPLQTAEPPDMTPPPTVGNPTMVALVSSGNPFAESTAPSTWSLAPDGGCDGSFGASSSSWAWASSSSSTCGVDPALVEELLVPLAPSPSVGAVGAPRLAGEEVLDTKSKKQLDRKRAKQEQQLKRRGSSENLVDNEGATTSSPTSLSPLKTLSDDAWSNVRAAALSNAGDIFKRTPSADTSNDVSALDALLSGCAASKRVVPGTAPQQSQPIWPKLSASLFTPAMFGESGSSAWSTPAGDDLDPDASEQATTLRNLLAMVNPSSSPPLGSASSTSSSLPPMAVPTRPPAANSVPSWSPRNGTELAGPGPGKPTTMSHSSTFSGGAGNRGKEVWLQRAGDGSFAGPSGFCGGSSTSSPWMVSGPPSVDGASSVSSCSALHGSVLPGHVLKAITKADASSGRNGSTRSRSSSGGGSISSTCSTGLCASGTCIHSACKVAHSVAASSQSTPACTAVGVSTSTNTVPPPTSQVDASGAAFTVPDGYGDSAAPNHLGPPADMPWSVVQDPGALGPAPGWYPVQFGSPPFAPDGPDYGLEMNKGMMYGMPGEVPMDPHHPPLYYPMDGGLENPHDPQKLPLPHHPLFYPPMFPDAKGHPYPPLYPMPHGGPFPPPHMHVPLPGAHPMVPMMYEAMR
eukprot:GGOE01002718.1.p1 GENE.GGOE01002718.1~~GGOE01002718.1.p1  ORF type:complete len:2047 (+),score=446.98 GGOE01002718.1:336-6143(+)